MPVQGGIRERVEAAGGVYECHDISPTVETAMRDAGATFRTKEDLQEQVGTYDVVFLSSVVHENIPEKDVVIHIKPANTHGGGLTKEKAMRKLFPEARIIEEKWDNAYNCALSTTGPTDPGNKRRKIARAIREIGEANPPIRRGDLLPAESFNYPFEEVLSWLRTYVDAGYPVIFKDEAARYIIESMVAYLKRPEGETGIFNFQENKLSDEASVLTRMDRDTIEEVEYTRASGALAHAGRKLALS